MTFVRTHVIAYSTNIVMFTQVTVMLLVVEVEQHTLCSLSTADARMFPDNGKGLLANPNHRNFGKASLHNISMKTFL